MTRGEPIYLLVMLIVLAGFNVVTAKINMDNNMGNREGEMFHNLTQEERQDYVKWYLDKNYDLECETTKIKRK